MSRTVFRRWAAAAILAGLMAQASSGAEVDPCTKFKWDVSRELAVMQQTPQVLAAAVKPGASVPEVKIGTLYALQLADQAGVTFIASPAKSHASDGATAGIVHFRTGKAGRYRVSITDGHWIDIVDGADLLKSEDFQGHVGCARPSKIVEFVLPAKRVLALQLSGSNGAAVVIAITAVDGKPAN
ncbi:MAG TPA: hypothetical protein VII70_01910 [Steroidobacteraceae bacterium]